MVGSVVVESAWIVPASFVVPNTVRELLIVGSLLLTTATIAPVPTVKFCTVSGLLMVAGINELSCALSVGPGTRGFQFCAISQVGGFPEAGFHIATTGPVIGGGASSSGVGVGCVGCGAARTTVVTVGALEMVG